MPCSVEAAAAARCMDGEKRESWLRVFLLRSGYRAHFTWEHYHAMILMRLNSENKIMPPLTCECVLRYLLF